MTPWPRGRLQSLQRPTSNDFFFEWSTNEWSSTWSSNEGHCNTTCTLIKRLTKTSSVIPNESTVALSLPIIMMKYIHQFNRLRLQETFHVSQWRLTIRVSKIKVFKVSQLIEINSHSILRWNRFSTVKILSNFNFKNRFFQ